MLVCVANARPPARWQASTYGPPYGRKPPTVPTVHPTAALKTVGATPGLNRTLSAVIIVFKIIELAIITRVTVISGFGGWDVSTGEGHRCGVRAHRTFSDIFAVCCGVHRNEISKIEFASNFFKKTTYIHFPDNSHCSKFKADSNTSPYAF